MFAKFAKKKNMLSLSKWSMLESHSQCTCTFLQLRKVYCLYSLSRFMESFNVMILYLNPNPWVYIKLVSVTTAWNVSVHFYNNDFIFKFVFGQFLVGNRCTLFERKILLSLTKTVLFFHSFKWSVCTPHLFFYYCV